MHTRFALHNFAGDPISYHFVDGSPVQTEEVSEEAQINHHVILVDGSGSMYRDMPHMRNTLLKILTLDEYSNAKGLVTLISYASMGDMNIHFQRIAIEDVMAAGSAHKQEIESLRVRGLTCISQALEAAKGLVKDDEVTAITLHSDGYANDRSAASERRVIEKIVNEFSGMDNVFINTIAYSMWSDFQLLAGIANGASGKCVQATTIRDVYDALHETSKLLAGNMTPAILLPLGDADYQVFLSADGKINGGRADIVVKGVKPTTQKDVFRFREVTKAEYEASSHPVCGDGASDKALFAYARANLAEGNLNTAKYALVSTRDGALLGNHYRALTSGEIANFMAGLDEVLFRHGTHPKTADYGLGLTGVSILEVLGIMGQHSGAIKVDMKALKSVYTKQGMRRVAGVRNEDGDIDVPEYHTEFVSDAELVEVRGFDLNRNTATINMLITRPVKLMKGASHVAQVAGVDLGSLSSFNNYTLVSNGSLNVPFLNVQIGSKKLYRALVDAGLSLTEYNPESVYTINFSAMPLVDFGQDSVSLDGVFPALAQLRVMGSILAACTKGESEALTAEQVAELKACYLTPSLNFSPPTTNEYADLNDALATGQVDTKISYKVDIGDREIVNLSKLHSANKFLDRMFTATQDGAKVKKPTFALIHEPNVVWDHKVLSARTKVTAIDHLMKPIFEDFLGLADNETLKAGMQMVGAGDMADRIPEILSMGKDDRVEFCKELQRKVEAKQDAIYTDTICPLVFYIGSSGLLPDDMVAQAMSADELEAQLPGIKLAKGEKEGTFFLVGEAVVSIFTKSEYVSR